MPKDSTISSVSNDLSQRKKAMVAFQNAIDNVILEHQRLNLPLYISRDGKVVAISAEEALKERAKEQP